MAVIESTSNMPPVMTVYVYYVSKATTVSGTAGRPHLRKARGEYIAVLDSDDIAAPASCLESQVAWLDEHPNTVC